MSKTNSAIPGQQALLQTAIPAFSNPCYDNGPNDQGVGYKIPNSLGRVGLGFALAVLVALARRFCCE